MGGRCFKFFQNLRPPLNHGKRNRCRCKWRSCNVFNTTGCCSAYSGSGSYTFNHNCTRGVSMLRQAVLTGITFKRCSKGDVFASLHELCSRSAWSWRWKRWAEGGRGSIRNCPHHVRHFTAVHSLLCLLVWGLFFVRGCCFLGNPKWCGKRRREQVCTTSSRFLCRSPASRGNQIRQPKQLLQTHETYPVG